MRILLIVGLLVGAAVVAVVMTSMRPEPPKNEREILDPLVEVLALENMTARFEIESQGTVRPRTETTLSAEVSGSIVRMSPKFVAGGVFEANEILLRIDPTNYQVALEQAKALVSQRTIEFEGARKLQSQGYRAQSELASATAALAAAKAEQVRAEKNLQRSEIRLPYEGIVRSKDTDLGEFVGIGTPLGVVFATGYAEVRLPLTDRDLAYIELPSAAATMDGGHADGPNVVLSATQKGRRVEWPARIVRTEGVVDEKSRVTYVVAEIADPYQLHGDGIPIPVGTFVSAKIEGATAENVIRIPRSLVRGTDELVFVNDANKLDIRNVDIVHTDSEYAYLGSGAAPGDRVVTTVLESAINGLKVRTASSP